MYLRRIGLFLVTNLAVLLVLSIAVRVLGLDRWVQAEIGLDYPSLLVMAAVFGFGGALVSLAMSKWLAKTTMRVALIERPESEDERWLVETVRALAQRAKIGPPEVGVFESSDLNAFATGARRGITRCWLSGPTPWTLFRSHPPLEVRIAVLEQRLGGAPIHRPLTV